MNSDNLSPSDQYNLSYNQRQMSAASNSNNSNTQSTGSTVYSTTTHERRVTTSRSPECTTTHHLNLPGTSGLGRCDSQQTTSAANQEAIIRRGEIIEPGERVIRWSSVERCAVSSPSTDYQVQVVQPLHSPITSNQEVYRSGSRSDAHATSVRDGRYCSESVTTLDGGDSLTLVILNCSPNQAASGEGSFCQSPSRANSTSRASEVRDCYGCQTELTIRHELVPIDHSVCQQHQRNYLQTSPSNRSANTTEIEEVTTTTNEETECRKRREQRHTQHEHYQQWLADQNRSKNQGDNNEQRNYRYQPAVSRQQQQQQHQQSQLTYEQIERSYEEQMKEFENQIQQSYITTPKRQYTAPQFKEPEYASRQPTIVKHQASPTYYQEDPGMPLHTSAKPSAPREPTFETGQSQEPSTSRHAPENPARQQKQQQQTTPAAQKSGTRLIKKWDFNQQQFVYTEVPEQKWKAPPPPPSKQPPEKEPEPVWTQHRIPDVESVQSDPLYSDLMLELQRLEEGVQVKPEQVIVEPETFQKPIFGQKILPEHVEINEYENVEFVCRLIPISDPQMKVEWSVNGRPLPEGSRYMSECEFGVVKLRIKRCEAEDSGIYQCKATNAMGEASATASLRVHAKGLVQSETLHPAGLDKIRQLENPKPVEHFEEQPVQQPPKFLTHITDYVEKDEGDSVHFECCLGPVEDPDLKTEWFFNGRPLVTGSRFHTIDDFGFIVLDIDWLFPRDTGEYVCRATNKYGTDITRTVLRVRPAKNIVLESQLDNSDQVIDKLRRLEFPDVEQEFFVEEPDKPAHFVQPLRSEANRRQFVEGDNVHFEARVGPATDGNLTVEWYHNDKPLISGHRFKPTFDFGHIQLDILYVYPEDSGVYKCVAKNAAGTDVSQFEIHVTGKPSLVYQTQLPKEMEGGVQKINEMEAMWNRAPDPEEDEAPAEKMAPQFVLKPKPCTAFEGSCARFCCRVVGHPRPRLTWTLNGQNVVSGSRHKLTYDGMYHLTIPKCQLSDAGKVEVHARNLLGECLCATELNVKRKVDDYRGVLKNSPNPWYDEQSLKVYQRQRSQDLTDDEDFCTFQANRLQVDNNQVIGYMEPDTPDVNLLATQKQAPLVPPGDMHPSVAERQVVLAPAPSTIQKALYVKDTIKPPEKHVLLSAPRRKQHEQDSEPQQHLSGPSSDLDQEVDVKEQQPAEKSKPKKPGHIFGLDLPRYTPQASTSGLQSPAIDSYRSKDVQQDYWVQQRFQQEQHMARQNQLKLEHQKQQKLEQQQQMAQHQQYQREKQEMREKQQQRLHQQKLQREQEELQRQLQQQQQIEQQMALLEQQQQQQAALEKERQQAVMYQEHQRLADRQLQQQQVTFQQQAAAIQDAERLRQQQQQQQRQPRARQQLHRSDLQQQAAMNQGQENMRQQQQYQAQEGAAQQVFDPRLPPPPSPESKVHGKEVHFHTHKQTQKERLGENREVLREIIDKEIFEQEHTGKTKDNVLRGSSAERGSVTPDSSLREHQIKLQDLQKQQNKQLKQQRQVRFQEEQEEREVLVEEFMIPPEFIQKIQPVRALDGGEARFECTYIGDPKPTISWFRESKLIKPSNLYVITTDPEESKSTLVIRRVTVNANAVYTVKAENVAGSAKSSANLVVEPVPTGPQNQIEFLARRSASPAGSRPSSSASGGFLASSSSQRTSNVTSTTTATTTTASTFDQGDGSFAASGSVSDDQSSDSQKIVKSVRTRKLSAEQMASLIRATSESSLVPPTFLHTIHDVQSKPGELVRLDARLIGTPPMEVRWAKDGERLRADRSHKMVLEGDLYTLLILECSQRDEGLYECLASNQVGEARCEARLTIGDSQIASTKRSSSAMGSRSPDDLASITFRSHSAAGGSISPASNYSSTSVTAESSSAHASTQQKRHYGLQKHSYSPLMTQYTSQSGSSQQEIIPRLIKRLENQEVREGKSVTLRCQISSFPIVEVYWYKQGDKLIKPSKYFRIFKDNDETYCLKILETFPEDQGEYKCVAKAPNGQAHVETKALITVIPNSPR